jgi:hypothetical protein
MGVVYEVLDAITGDHYAIKRLLPEYVSRPDVVEMFRTEGAASMRFTNKSLRFVTTQMVDIEVGIPYIVLQLIRHPTLRTVMQNSGGRFPLDTALPILSEIAAALSDLHALGYVHRDLKPENIFVDSSDTEPSIMLVDFGLSKDGGNATRTAMRGAGTERYASPEQMRGDTTSPATDVYAFGVIAYEVLTGELPRYGESLTDYVPDASGQLDSLVSACLAGRADERIANGSAMVQRMRDIQGKSNNAAITPKLQAPDISKKEPDVPLPTTQLTSILRFPDLQSGANVTVDGVAIAPGVEFVCDLPAGTTKKVAVIATWEGVDLYRGAVDVRAGETKAITTRKAYRIDCDGPKWCEVKDASGKRVIFPVRGVLADPPAAVVFYLFHRGKEFDKRTFFPNAGVQVAEINHGIGTIRLVDVPAGHVVRINGDIVANPYLLPIVLGDTVSLSIRVYNANREEIFTETVTLSANESKQVIVPMTTSEAPTTQEPALDVHVQRDVPGQPGSREVLTRRLVIGGGIAGVIGSGFAVSSLVRTFTNTKVVSSSTVKPTDQSVLSETSIQVMTPDWRIMFPELIAYISSLRSISAGEFTMGSESGFSDEKPVHSVTLSAFRMGATPVTVAVWNEYCRAQNLNMPNPPDWGWIDDHPIVNVSWNDIMGEDGNGGFCAWASEQTGFKLTLPTEAQHEFSSLGGRDGLVYPWGNTFDNGSLWCSILEKRLQTAPTLRNQYNFPNDYLLNDMAGNVWQWCSDLYAGYGSDSQIDPAGPDYSDDDQRCVRGGSWRSADPTVFRCANRVKSDPSVSDYDTGFRLSAGPG